MYNSSLERLEEIIERLKALGSEASGAGAGLIAQAKSLAAMGQFADASARLEAAHDLLSDALWQAEAAQGKPTTAGAGLAKEFQARLTVLAPRVKDALAAGGPQAQDLKLALSEVQVFARKQDFAQGMKTLDRVAALLQNPSSTPLSGDKVGGKQATTPLNAAPAGGNPRLKAALQNWTAARTAAVGQLKKLIDAFASCDPTAHRLRSKCIRPPLNHRSPCLRGPPAAAWLGVG